MPLSPIRRQLLLNNVHYNGTWEVVKIFCSVICGISRSNTRRISSSLLTCNGWVFVRARFRILAGMDCSISFFPFVVGVRCVIRLSWKTSCFFNRLFYSKTFSDCEIDPFVSPGYSVTACGVSVERLHRVRFVKDSICMGCYPFFNQNTCTTISLA